MFHSDKPYNCLQDCDIAKYICSEKNKILFFFFFLHSYSGKKKCVSGMLLRWLQQEMVYHNTKPKQRRPLCLMTVSLTFLIQVQVGK